MLPHLGVPELLIVLLIVIIVFGVGKLPQIGGAIGQSIREFREATRAGQEKKDEEKRSSRRSASKAASSEEEEGEESEEA